MGETKYASLSWIYTEIQATKCRAGVTGNRALRIYRFKGRRTQRPQRAGLQSQSACQSPGHLTVLQKEIPYMTSLM